MVAIGYDSRVDKFRKIENLWPNLYRRWNYTEGLCYEAIMNDFVPSSNRDSLFLKLLRRTNVRRYSFDYYGEEALQHTKRQVKEIVKKGIQVLSYFVGDEIMKESRNMDDFKTMYGKDAELLMYQKYHH